MKRLKENILFPLICGLCIFICTILLVIKYYEINKEKSDYDGKKAIVLGDSIADGTLFNGGNVPWMKSMEDSIGLIVDNEAVNTTAVGICEGYGINENYNDFSLCRIVNWKPFEKYDICMIAYGTIDYFYQMELGEPDYMDCNTFYGAFNYSIQTILQKNPDIEIILLTPIYNFKSEAENEKNQTMDEYREAIGVIAKKYNLKLIDMKEALSDPGLYDKNNMAFPNAEGYKKMGAYLETALREEKYSAYPEVEYNAANLLEEIDSIFDQASHGELELSGIQVESSLQDLKLKANQFYYVTIEYDSPVDDRLQIDFWNEKRQQMISYRVFPIEAGENRIRRIKIEGPDRDRIGEEYNLRIGTCYDESLVRIKQIMVAEDGYCR